MQARQREQQKLLDQQKRDRENAVMINKQRKR
jgi:hypothetical protein